MTKDFFDVKELTYFKRKFNHQLEPIKVMLVHRRDALTHEAWLDFVSRTRVSILEKPHQFLEELPERSMFEYLVDTIFKEFVEREMNHRL